ncbi:MAG TPA: DUF2809 domain-containing protein [Dinghuibacter sp.]|uniref:ribosomal maturation YjgA family protein n=1 Tax=Dinghuibacter sp. TaxID=2024697 RepID=UPI002BDD2C0E|nr:DUF2809 domain-containing protein [Dinghuibacter sp.]HTJ13333.1 DUF2809 domain-containing protein [Dinghuibacter sp.]
MRLKPRYLALAAALTGIELFIGEKMHDDFVRPYVGDYLVVILLYCFVRGVTRIAKWPAALGVLVFAYAIETGQYFHIADRLGFTRPSLMRTMIGTFFTWNDILCYTLGILSVLGAEKICSWHRLRSSVRSGVGRTPSC